MIFTDIIEKKKKGSALSRAEIEFFISGMMSGEIPDYQISALLMAIVLKGMTDEETFYLTDAMLHSGEMLEKGEICGTCVDKHSTGGVSDSTTLIVVPVVCALGLKFAKLSGRGLGHTGGTIDKLESFNGFNVNLTRDEFTRLVNSVGGAISGQTAETAPADKKLYALRDVTATVDSIPLIASSIMSKKLASFADVIVLDVKYGSGAFMKTAEEAERLASLMVKIGKNAGRRVSALITSMNQPLGDSVGCNAEVRGAIEVLRGKENDLKRVSCVLARELLVLSGWDEMEAEKAVCHAIESGDAIAKLKEIIVAQGGDPSCADDPSLLSMGRYSAPIICEKGGYLALVDAEAIGNANVVLGGGRLKKTDEIDHQSGIIVRARIGDKLSRGDVLATAYTNNEGSLAAAVERLSGAFTVCGEKPKGEALIHNLIR